MGLDAVDSILLLTMVWNAMKNNYMTPGNDVAVAYTSRVQFGSAPAQQQPVSRQLTPQQERREHATSLVQWRQRRSSTQAAHMSAPRAAKLDPRCIGDPADQPSDGSSFLAQQNPHERIPTRAKVTENKL